MTARSPAHLNMRRTVLSSRSVFISSASTSMAFFIRPRRHVGMWHSTNWQIRRKAIHRCRLLRSRHVRTNRWMTCMHQGDIGWLASRVRSFSYNVNSVNTLATVSARGPYDCGPQAHRAGVHFALAALEHAHKPRTRDAHLPRSKQSQHEQH